MSVSIGSLAFPDAWIKNKWGGTVKTGRGLKQWIQNGQKAFNIPLPPCVKVEQENRQNVVYAIDGTPYNVRCGEFNENDSPSFNISASGTQGKVGDYIYINIVLGGGVLFYGIDNYGREHRASQSTIIAIRLTDEWDRYELVYRACFNGQSYANGSISVEVLQNDRLSTERENEKEIVINTLSSSQAVALGALLGTRVNISDPDITFQNALITAVEVEYMAEDMPDVITRTVHNANIYKARVRFVP